MLGSATDKLDVVVFGASGFTGCRVLAYLQKIVSSEAATRKIAVAGRSKDKLLDALKFCGCSTVSVEIIVADVKDPSSLDAMAKRSRLVLNCVGPYRYWGEPVFASCCANGTDYLDVTGEPEFIERMEYKYNRLAQKTGALMASAAGFDSVVADVGVLFALQQFQPPAVPSAVESFLTLHPGKAGAKGHFPTWESAVLGFSSAQELSRLRKEVRSSGHAPSPPSVPGPKLRARSKPAHDQRVSAWAVPFPGSDASIVRRTQAYRGAQGQPAVHYAAYFTITSRLWLLLAALVGTVFQALSQRAWGRKLLLRFPGIFSLGMFTHAGPTEQQMATTSFSMTFYARGYAQGAPASDVTPPDMEVVTRIAGPEPGFVATPILMVECAMALLQLRDSSPPVGGVFTVGSLLAESSLIERLQQSGVSFDVVSKRQL